MMVSERLSTPSRNLAHANTIFVDQRAKTDHTVPPGRAPFSYLCQALLYVFSEIGAEQRGRALQ